MWKNGFYWFDLTWILGARPTTLDGQWSRIANLHDGAFDIMHRLNEYVISTGLSLEPEMDRSYDRFQNVYGKGKYEISAHAAKRFGGVGRVV